MAMLKFTLLHYCITTYSTLGRARQQLSGTFFPDVLAAPHDNLQEGSTRSPLPMLWGTLASVVSHTYDDLSGRGKRQRTAALQDARAPSNVPDIVKRLGMRLRLPHGSGFRRPTSTFSTLCS